MYTNEAKITGHQAQPFWREWADKTFFDLTGCYYSTLPHDEASVLAPMVIGDDSQLTDTIKSAYRDAGTTHILVVSGMNVAYVIIVIVFIFKVFNVPLRLAQLLTIPFIILYTLATGANPPVVRASIMAIMIVLAMALERESEVYNAMAASVLVVIYLNPQSIFTPSFLLSYGATFGILYFYRHLTRPFSKLPSLLRAVIDVAAVTISSQLIVGPIIASTFNRVSLAGIFCNLLVVPLAGVITITGIVHYGIYKLAPIILPASIFVNYWLVHIQNVIVEYFAALPHASIRVPTPSLLAIAGYYLAIWAFVRPKIKTRIILGGAGVMLAAIGFIGHNIPIVKQPQKFEITALRLGSADAMFVSMPNGKLWLVDAGVAGKRANDNAISAYLWHKGIGSIDMVILTGTGADRTGALAQVIEHFSPRKIILPYSINLNLQNIEVIRPSQDYSLSDGSVTVRIWPVDEISGKKEKLSYVTQIVTSQGVALFCGDIGKKEQNKLSARAGALLKSDVMTLPAHGKVALDRDFLAAIHPQLIIASTGKKKLPNLAGIRIISTLEGAQRILLQGTTIQTELLKD
jgi:competence protein ComEC